MDRQIETTDRQSSAAQTALKNGVTLLQRKQRDLERRKREAQRITDRAQRSRMLRSIRADEVALDQQCRALQAAVTRARQS